jgi:hypothetical protein
MRLAVKTVISTPKISTCKALFFDVLQTVTGFHPYPEHTPIFGAAAGFGLLER